MMFKEGCIVDRLLQFSLYQFFMPVVLNIHFWNSFFCTMLVFTRWVMVQIYSSIPFHFYVKNSLLKWWVVAHRVLSSVCICAVYCLFFNSKEAYSLFYCCKYWGWISRIIGMEIEWGRIALCCFRWSRSEKEMVVLIFVRKQLILG